jgi:hypothetical protein
VKINITQIQFGANPTGINQVWVLRLPTLLHVSIMSRTLVSDQQKICLRGLNTNLSNYSHLREIDIIFLSILALSISFPLSTVWSAAQGYARPVIVVVSFTFYHLARLIIKVSLTPRRLDWNKLPKNNSSKEIHVFCQPTPKHK